MAGKACFTSKIHRSLHLCKTSRNNPASRLFVLLQIFATTTSVDKFVDARFAHKLWESPAALSTCGEIASVHGLFTGLIHRSAKGGRIRTDPTPRVAGFYPQGYAAVCRFAINCRVAMAQDVKRPARGAAPAMLALWSFLLLQETPHRAGLFGLIILLVGLLVVGGSAWWKKNVQMAPSLGSIGLALIVALCISAYSVSDGAAVKFVNPTGYVALEMALTALFVTPLIILRYRWRVVQSEWRSSWPRITLVGLLSNFTYLLVLFAYTMAPVGYAGAIREVSVVFAALAGWLWLDERFGSLRAIGATVIFAGILVIAVAG